MKKILMGACAFSMLLTASCNNEGLIGRAEQQRYTLEVGVGMNSRTYNDEDGECNWGDNEQIYVFSEDKTVSSVLTLLKKNGNTATFAGTVSGDPSKLKYTVYPVPNENGKIEIRTVDGNNHNAPMYGTIEGGGAKLSFAGGVVKLDINGAGDDEFKASGEKSSGNTQVTGGHYTFNMNTKKLEFVPDGNSTVTITDIPSDGVVFLPVATSADLSAGQKDDVSLTLTTPKGEEITEIVKVAQGASTQSKENAFPSVNYDSESGVMANAEIGDVAELKKALEVGGEYELTDNIVATETLEIGKNITIKGNGYSVTSSARYVFEITTSDINVAMDTVKIVSTALQTYTNDIRGINIRKTVTGAELILKNCEVRFDPMEGDDWAYAVNQTAGSGNSITIRGGYYEGANVINVWGCNHTVDIDGATLKSLYGENKEYVGVCVKLDGNDEHESRGNSLMISNTTFEGEHAIPYEVVDLENNNLTIYPNNTDKTKEKVAGVGEE